MPRQPSGLVLRPSMPPGLASAPAEETAARGVAETQLPSAAALLTVLLAAALPATAPAVKVALPAVELAPPAVWTAGGHDATTLWLCWTSARAV